MFQCIETNRYIESCLFLQLTNCIIPADPKRFGRPLFLTHKLSFWPSFQQTQIIFSPQFRIASPTDPSHLGCRGRRTRIPWGAARCRSWRERARCRRGCGRTVPSGDRRWWRKGIRRAEGRRWNRYTPRKYKRLTRSTLYTNYTLYGLSMNFHINDAISCFSLARPSWICRQSHLSELVALSPWALFGIYLISWGQTAF